MPFTPTTPETVEVDIPQTPTAPVRENRALDQYRLDTIALKLEDDALVSLRASILVGWDDAGTFRQVDRRTYRIEGPTLNSGLVAPVTPGRTLEESLRQFVWARLVAAGHVTGNPT